MAKESWTENGGCGIRHLNLNRAERCSASQTTRKTREQLRKQKREAPDPYFAPSMRGLNRALWGETRRGLLELPPKNQTAKLAMTINSCRNCVRGTIGRNSLKCKSIHLCVGN